jgi:hypothetical protein
MQITAAIARRGREFSKGLRVGAAQFCMGPRNQLAGQLQGAKSPTIFRRKES